VAGGPGHAEIELHDVHEGRVGQLDAACPDVGRGVESQAVGVAAVGVQHHLAHGLRTAVVGRAPRRADDTGPCSTRRVACEGPAEDANAWMHHYLTQHPPLMRQLPGLRELEICSSLDAVAFVPGRRVRHLQRNKVAFDSAAALDAALQSPVREQMRRDFASFPADTGRVLHHPMLTRAVRIG
jgi:uncharacterized protein (TIGR02118 family)